jgi:protein kinase-like protein
MVADYTVAGNSFTPSKPSCWSESPIGNLNGGPNFDVPPDGKRILAAPPIARDATKANLQLTFLLNFFEEVKRKLPRASTPRLPTTGIVSELGEGAMGAVYRATGTKLNRAVAIKILPDAFSDDPGRLARFQREAQVLASLNHPNIPAIYGVEDRAS